MITFNRLSAPILWAGIFQCSRSFGSMDTGSGDRPVTGKWRSLPNSFHLPSSGTCSLFLYKMGPHGPKRDRNWQIGEFAACTSNSLTPLRFGFPQRAGDTAPNASSAILRFICERTLDSFFDSSALPSF
jgi:hypothetical protein